MTAVYEGSQFAYWIGKQPGGQGSPTTAQTTALGVTGGTVSVSRTDGQERFPTYGGRFYSGVDWVDSAQGEGELTVAAHPSSTAALASHFLGTESVGGAGPYTHSLTAATASRWVSVVKKAGVNEGTGAGAPRIERYNDGRITQLVFEGSTANKMLRVTPTFLFADPGEIYATTPSATISATDRPFVYTDGSAAFKFSAITGTALVQSSTTSFQITMNDTLNPAPGDTITPLGYLPGESVCSCAIETTAATESLQEFNKLVYGHHPLVTGDKPVATLPAVYGSVDIKLTYGAGASLRSVQFLIPSVKWTPTGEIATNTDGSATTLSFTGEARGTTNLATVIVVNGDSAVY